MATAAINVQVNADDKIEATKILTECGISMSALISMTLKQVIRVKGVPFKVTAEEYYSDELIEAFKESEQILKDIKSGNRKPYDNTDDLFNALND